MYYDFRNLEIFHVIFAKLILVTRSNGCSRLHPLRLTSYRRRFDFVIVVQLLLVSKGGTRGRLKSRRIRGVFDDVSRRNTDRMKLGRRSSTAKSSILWKQKESGQEIHDDGWRRRNASCASATLPPHVDKSFYGNLKM